MTRARRDPAPADLKRAVAALAAVPALVLLLATTRTWVTGRSGDAAAGRRGGGHGRPGRPGSRGPRRGLPCRDRRDAHGRTQGRLLSAVLHLLAALGALLSVASVLRDPGLALGRVAAGGLGRSGSVPTDASVTGWVWVAMVCAVVLLVGSVVALGAVGRWSDSPVGTTPRPSPRMAAPDQMRTPPSPALRPTEGSGPRRGTTSAAVSTRPTPPTCHNDLSLQNPNLQ